MTLRNKIYFFIINLGIFLTLFILGSNNFSFHGDEIGTLDIKNIHKPVPYHQFISWMIDAVGKFDVHKILIYRLSSFLFTAISIFIWIFLILKNSKQVFLFSLFILTNSLILRESFFFRYYSFYFLSSSIVLLIILLLTKRCTNNIKLIISFMGILISPYVFFILNTIQFGFYFLYILLFKMIKSSKIRLLSIGVIFLIFISFLFKPSIIWNFFYWLKITDHANISLNSKIFHGLTAPVLLKPVYAIFQMIFGYFVPPTYSIVIISLFTFLVSIMGHSFYQMYLFKREMFFTYLVSFIFPFLTIYIFFQSISLPGFTQLESKHGLLILPFLIILIIDSNKYLSKFVFRIFFSILITSQIFGLTRLFKYDDLNWSMIIQRINSKILEDKSSGILIDGRSKEAFKIYSANKISEKDIRYTYENMEYLDPFLEKNNKICLVLNDYKSYHKLSLKQNWNSGKSSYSRYDQLGSIIEKLNNKFELEESYVNYPLFMYILKKKVYTSDEIKSFGVWEYHLKDLSLPTLSNPKIQSSILVPAQSSVKLNYSEKLILNLEGFNKNIEIGDKIGLCILEKDSVNLTYGVNVWNIFSDYFNTEYDQNKIFHSWVHEPLVSGSIRYPGSFYKHRANVYFIDLPDIHSKFVTIKNTSQNLKIRVWQN